MAAGKLVSSFQPKRRHMELLHVFWKVTGEGVSSLDRIKFILEGLLSRLFSSFS